MQILKFIFGTLLILFGLAVFLGGVAGLPEGIEGMNQGRPATSGRDTGGLWVGPLIIWGGIALWRSGLYQLKMDKVPDVSMADRVRDSEESAR